MKLSRDPIKQHMDRCRHFNGVQNDNCSAGVAYADVRDDSAKPRRLPCFLSDEATTACSSRSLPTREEAEQHRVDMRRRIEAVGKARRSIVDAIGTPKGGASGSIPCPICTTGTLRYSRSSINGHIHAGCSTPGCVRWME